MEKSTAETACFWLLSTFLNRVRLQEPTQFCQGDVVVHTRRPEWGDGVVSHASTIIYEGQPAQRLAVRFANRGQVTVNTAVATLKPKESEGPMTRTSTSVFSSSTTGQGWLGSIDKKSDDRQLWSLPEPLTDPFASLADRLKVTLESYRFSHEPRILIEWAVVQTGLNDPLSQYNRHELEQAFVRFERDRDRHLAELVRLIKKQGQNKLLEQQINEMGSSVAGRALAKAVRG